MAKSNKFEPIDQEEKDLINALEKLEIENQLKPNNEKQKMFKAAAENFVKKETKMNIRIDPIELEEIKKRAAIEGLKYQSLVKSVLHKYVTGQLVENNKR